MAERDDDENKPLVGGAHIRVIQPSPTPQVLAFDAKAVAEFLEAFPDAPR